VTERRHAKAKAAPKRASTKKRVSASRPTGRPTAPSRVRRATSGSSPGSASARSRLSARRGPLRKPSGATKTKRSPTAKRGTTTKRPTTTKRVRPTGGTGAERVAAETRRNRMPVALGAAAAAVILVTSFPLSVLLSQHRQLSAAASQLSAVQHQNGLLAEQRQQLNSNAEVKRLARQNYQLVDPGRSLYVILPPAGTNTAAAPGAPTAGDPALQPLVAPSHAPNMSPDPGLPATTVPASTGGGGTTTPTPPAKPSGGFWSRVGSTLEFWK